MDEKDPDEGDVMHLGKKDDDEWEEITITIDSGAVGTVGPKGIGSGYPIQQNRSITYGDVLQGGE